MAACRGAAPRGLRLHRRHRDDTVVQPRPRGGISPAARAWRRPRARMRHRAARDGRASVWEPTRGAAVRLPRRRADDRDRVARRQFAGAGLVPQSPRASRGGAASRRRGARGACERRSGRGARALVVDRGARIPGVRDLSGAHATHDPGRRSRGTHDRLTQARATAQAALRSCWLRSRPHPRPRRCDRDTPRRPSPAVDPQCSGR